MMNKLPDRAKLRREYLQKKAAAYSLLIGTGLLAFCGFGFASLIGILVILIFALTGTHVFDSAPPPTAVEVFSGPAAPLFLLGIGGGIACLFLNKATKKRLEAIPYVPPISDQLPTLPAEEVLLRGSQASSASPAELLRPAGEQETPAEELLQAAERQN